MAAKRKADPARTHALLVGVELAGVGRPLDGPMNDMLQYHLWLCARGVPPGQIQTLVSPLESNRAALAASGVATSPATSASVRQALNALRGKRATCSSIAWGRHGVVNDEMRRLLVADATAADMRHVSLEALLKSLASSWFGGFARQVVLVDTCSNFQEFTFSMPAEELPVGTPMAPEQFVFFESDAPGLSISPPTLRRSVDT